MTPDGFEECAKCGKPLAERPGDLCDGCQVAERNAKRALMVDGDTAQKRLGEL
jgi:NMD protein affecting ribosome stability and mRNA decay